MTRKGQSAMEYLMTYGWAILVIIIVIAVLFYIGVLNPRNVTPSSCTFPPGISCASYKLNVPTATPGALLDLQLGQATGHSIKIWAIRCATETEDSVGAGVNMNDWTLDGWGGENVTIPMGEKRWVSGSQHPNNTMIECFYGVNFDSYTNVTGAAGEFYKGKISIAYTEINNGVNRTAIGDLSAKFE